MNKIAVTCFGRIYQIYIRDEADQSVFAEIFKEHEYRSVEEIIKNAKYPVVDIGAHAGFFSLYARAINPTVRIISVEPERKNLEILRRHIMENNVLHTEIIEDAIGGRSEKGKLLIASDSHNNRLLRKNEKDSGSTSNVNIITLSDLMKKCIIENISLVKMDIEGAEFEIFNEIDEDVLLKIQSFIIEYHSDFGDRNEIEEKLRINGFGVQTFPSRFDKKMGFIFALNKRFTYGK